MTPAAATGTRWVGSSTATSFAAGTDGTTAYHVGDSTNIKWHEGSVSREAREKMLNQKGCATLRVASGSATLLWHDHPVAMPPYQRAP
jgi:hypothetical protein